MRGGHSAGLFVFPDSCQGGSPSLACGSADQRRQQGSEEARPCPESLVPPPASQHLHFHPCLQLREASRWACRGVACEARLQSTIRSTSPGPWGHPRCELKRPPPPTPPLASRAPRASSHLLASVADSFLGTCPGPPQSRAGSWSPGRDWPGRVRAQGAGEPQSLPTLHLTAHCDVTAHQVDRPRKEAGWGGAGGDSSAWGWLLQGGDSWQGLVRLAILGAVSAGP